MSSMSRYWRLLNGLSRKQLKATPSLLVRQQILACDQAHKHTINRPVKAKADVLNPLYEDPSLNIEPERQEYPELWFNIKGYDFVPVESYLKFLHRFFNSMQLPAAQLMVPPRCWAISTYKPHSEIQDKHYELKRCHRLVKVHGVPNNTLSLILDIVTRHLPAGVELSVHEPDEALTEFRFVPDGDIKALNDALHDLDNPRLKKRKKGF